MRKWITYWFTVIVLAALCVVALYFNFSQSTPEDGGTSLSLRFSWAGIPACASISPAFALANVPAGTKSLNFMMTDLNMPTFHHGGSTIPYQGNLVSQGAISYTGPCPPHGERHNYRWTVQAQDAAGKVLDKATAEATFPP
ncbi:MAG TPA: YbhB/YbcL family Raf kinase inhibitor-like protein [Pseudolabrys sp.]|nr:YbhB/YbcL family Raf kinase inhibitor-like protein [Pseudolabrys sp.]